MTQASKRLAVLVLSTPSIYAYAQNKPDTPAPASGAASTVQPPPSKLISNPGDPTWLVAALVIGAIIGYLIGARRGNTRGGATHA